MAPTKVISTLKDRGVELWQEGGTLRYRARAGTLTEQDRATLRAHKAAILKALAQSTATIGSKPVAPSTAVTAASKRKKDLQLPAIQVGTAASNRQAMPQIAAAVDQLWEVFGTDQVQVIYACENGRELGQEPPSGVIAHPPHVPIKSRKGRQS